MMTIATTVPHPELSVSSMLSPFLRDNNPIKKIIPKRTPIPIVHSGQIDPLFREIDPLDLSCRFHFAMG